MGNKTSLLRCLFVTLFALGNIVMLLQASARADSRFGKRQLSFEQIPVNGYSGHSIFNKKLTARNDHIKVRYMGGDCGHDPSLPLLRINVPDFNLAMADLFTGSFIFSRAHFLFELRGPPAGIESAGPLA